MEEKYITAFKEELKALNRTVPANLKFGDDFADLFLKNLSWSTQLSDKFFSPYDPNQDVPEEERAAPDYEERPLYIKRGTSMMPASKELKQEMKAIVLATMERINFAAKTTIYDLESKDIIGFNKLADKVGACARHANNGSGTAPKLSIVKQYSASLEKKARNLELSKKANWLTLKLLQSFTMDCRLKIRKRLFYKLMAFFQLSNSA